jgi:hypothetical protein
MTNEEWYDKEISPKLLELAEECGKRGLSFVSVVEYEPGSRAHIRRLTEDAGLEMVMIEHSASTAPNIDGYVLGLIRYCREKAIDTGASIVMRKLTG